LERETQDGKPITRRNQGPFLKPNQESKIRIARGEGNIRTRRGPEKQRNIGFAGAVLRGGVRVNHHLNVKAGYQEEVGQMLLKAKGGLRNTWKRGNLLGPRPVQITCSKWGTGTSSYEERELKANSTDLSQIHQIHF